MKKYYVIFSSKGFNKTKIIDSQDEDTAKKWAEIQLKTWKRTANFTIGEVKK